VSQIGNDLFHFIVGNEGPVHTLDASAARHVKHITHAEQLFGALLSKDRAAVDLRGDLE
jgi:hypothetical protein